MMTTSAAETEGGRPAASTREYVCPQRDQLFLLPVSMRDWLEEGHLAWFVLDVVEALDTRGLHRRAGVCEGRPPYQPEMMCALLLYAYCCGIRSSRQIEQGCRTDAAFRVICGGLVPDHTTIARFVVCHEQALEDLFVEGVRVCAAAGLVDLSVVALDGTKIAADASLARNRDAAWIRREIAQLMALTAAQAPAAPAPERLAGLAPADGLPSPTARLARLQAALGVIEAEDAAAAQATARQTEAAMAQAAQGRLRKGRKPTDPHAALARAEIDHQAARTRVEILIAERERRAAAIARGETVSARRLRIDIAQRALERTQARLAQARAAAPAAPAPTTTGRVNITDPDSRTMSTRAGWIQGYNAQAIVNPHQIVLACTVSQDATDVQLFEPMTATLTRTLAAAGIAPEVELMLADAGYCSEHNLTCPGPDRLIATTKDWKQRRAARELGQTHGPPPPDSPPLQQMEHLLRTPQGATAYKQRSPLIEPVFGDHKHNRQIRRFRRRGLPAARSEWAFIHLAANILKLHHHTAPAAP